jgi:hypothetical protein
MWQPTFYQAELMAGSHVDSNTQGLTSNPPTEICLRLMTTGESVEALRQ